MVTNAAFFLAPAPVLQESRFYGESINWIRRFGSLNTATNVRNIAEEKHLP
jgi:hypothetical protein